MKKMKILIGYDGSTYADAALSDLKKAGLPRQADVLVLSAADVFLPPGRDTNLPEAIKPSILRARASARSEVKRASRLAAKGRKKIRSKFPSWNVKAASTADSPAWAILKKAETWKPDLIIVGAHGHSKLGRFLGSVSQMVLTHASDSVHVGRVSTGRTGGKLRVFAAIDGSPNSEFAIRSIASRSWPSGTEFLLVSVIDPKKSTFMERLASREIRWLLGTADSEREATERMLETFAKKLREKGLTVTCQVKKGDPKRVLVKEAESWKADWIFVGARGLSHLKRFLMGGVSMAVAARAHCSVEVVRR